MSKKLLATFVTLLSMIPHTEIMSELTKPTYHCQRCKKWFDIPIHKCPVCRGKVR